MYILAKITQAVNPALEKFKSGVKKHQKNIFLGFCIFLISVIGFNLGRINALNKTPAKTPEKVPILSPSDKQKRGSSFSQPNNNLGEIGTTVSQPKDLRVVASKASSSKKYHFTWCPGAKKIKEANKIWFETKALAQKAGYTLAGNCQ